jgi:hypothetical protein
MLAKTGKLISGGVTGEVTGEGEDDETYAAQVHDELFIFEENRQQLESQQLNCNRKDVTFDELSKNYF